MSKQKQKHLNDFDKIGPISIQGVEASDLPDGGRGSVETDPNKEAKRKLPQRTGENSTGATGLRGDPNVAEAADHGHRGKN